MTRFRSRFHPFPFVAILVLGVALLLPSLWMGFLLDDYLFIGALSGDFVEWRQDWDPFAFFGDSEAENASLVRKGGFPWWMLDSIHIQVFRPLSELLIRADFALHGKSAFGYHLHSLLWWSLVLLGCGLVFRRALPGTLGLLAFLLIAVDWAHVLPAAWIANRNALVALAPVMIGLSCHMRWREDGWRPGRFIALVGAALGLLGGEIALAALAYFFAYEFFGAPTTGQRSRFNALAPLASLVAVYVILYRLLGNGAEGSGLYLDPGRDPIAFLAAAASRIPTLLAGGIAGFSADFWIMTPPLRPALVIVGCTATLALLGLLRLCWSGLPEQVRCGLRWLLVGSALGLIPVVATFPADRMMLVPGIGITAAIATVINQAWRSWRTRRRWVLISAGAFLALMHLVLAPLYVIAVQSILIDQSRRSLDLAASPVVQNAGGKDTVIIFGPDHIVSLYLPLLVNHLQGPPSNSWRPLAIAPFDHRLRRPGPRTLELEVVDDGVMMHSIFELLYRDLRHPLRPGAVLDRGLFRAEILEGNDRGPTRVAFHFDRDLTDPSLYFLVWQDSTLRQATLPAIGEEIFLERTLGPAGF